MNALAQVRVGSRVVGARDATLRRARATRGTARARSAFETIGRSRARRVVASRARWTRGGDRASGGGRRAIARAARGAARTRARRGVDRGRTRAIGGSPPRGVERDDGGGAGAGARRIRAARATREGADAVAREVGRAGRAGERARATTKASAGTRARRED